MKIKTKTTKLTRQAFPEAMQQLDSLPRGGGHVSLDVVDDQGEVGHTCVFRGLNGGLYARRGTPDPRNLFSKLKRSLRLKRLTLAVSPKGWYPRPGKGPRGEALAIASRPWHD